MEQQPIALTFEYTRRESIRGVWQLRRHRPRNKLISLWWVGILLFIGVLFIIVGKESSQLAQTPPAGSPVGSWQRAPVPAPAVNPVADVVLPLLPWLIVFFFVWLALFQIVRRSYASQLTGQQRMYVFRAGGISFTAPYMRAELEWPIFQRMIETRQFFLLKISPMVGHVIPKRVFTDPEEMDRFRQMLKDHIDIPTARQAFPVLPAAPPPLPVDRH